MLYIACAILSFQFIYLVAIRKESIFAPVPMFSLVWATIIIFYKSGYVELFQLDFRSELIVLIGSIGFLLGRMKYKIGSRPSRTNMIATRNVSYLLKTNLVLVIALIVIMYQIFQGFHSIQLLANGYTFENIAVERLFYQGGGAISTLLNVFVVSPFTYIFIPMGAYHLISEKGDKRIAVCSILIVLTATLHHGGRASILYFVMYMFAFKSILGKQSKMKLKTKIIFFVIFVVLIIGVVVISQSRGITGYIDSIVIYVCGCLPNMDQRLFAGGDNPITCGGASLYGFIAPVFMLLKGIGIPYPEFFQNLQEIVNVENVLRIGPNTGYNAYVSIYYYLFLDGRELFVFVATIMFSTIACRQYRKVEACMTEREVVVYGLLLFQIVFSMIRVHFATWNYALSFIYLLILYKKNGGNLNE